MTLVRGVMLEWRSVKISFPEDKFCQLADILIGPTIGLCGMMSHWSIGSINIYTDTRICL